MEQDVRLLVLERLRELEGWSEYILEAIHLRQVGEPVQPEMLERMLVPHELREIRQLSWSLRDKLHLIATQLEFAPSNNLSSSARP